MDDKEPKTFWDKMRRLIGGSKGYIWSTHKQKLYDQRDKIKSIEGNLRSAQRETQSLMNIQRETEEYLLNNQERTILHEVADLNQLEMDNTLTKPINIFDLMAIVAKNKNTAPGELGVNKEILPFRPSATVFFRKFIASFIFMLDILGDLFFF